MTFSEWIIKFRKERKISQLQLSKDVGCSISSVLCWERGQFLPSTGNAKRISEAYNIDIPKEFQFKLMKRASKQDKQFDRKENNAISDEIQNSYGIKKILGTNNLVKTKGKYAILDSTSLCYLCLSDGVYFFIKDIEYANKFSSSVEANNFIKKLCEKYKFADIISNFEIVFVRSEIY